MSRTVHVSFTDTLLICLRAVGVAGGPIRREYGSCQTGAPETLTTHARRILRRGGVCRRTQEGIKPRTKCVTYL